MRGLQWDYSLISVTTREEIDLEAVIKDMRLRWLRHVCRMEEQRDLIKASEGKRGGWRLRTADMREWRGICDAARIQL
jgi:hypothetical protein